MIFRLGLFYFAAILFIVSGCQTDTPQRQVKSEKKVFARYYVKYSQNDRLYKAYASFSLGDSSINAIATEMAAVSFQGGNMEQKTQPRNDLSYVTERSGEYQPNLKFKYTDSEEKKHPLDLSFKSINSFLIKNKSISQSKGLTLVWDGSALEQEESLLLLFSDQENKAASTTIKGPSRTTEVNIPGNFLKELKPGKGNLFLVRKKKGEKKEGLIHYQYDLEYYTSPLEIEISK